MKKKIGISISLLCAAVICAVVVGLAFGGGKSKASSANILSLIHILQRLMYLRNILPVHLPEVLQDQAMETAAVETAETR